MAMLLSALHTATERAEAFLRERQDARGYWRDFSLPAGSSDAWVTGYVGAALMRSNRGELRGLAERGLRALTEAQEQRLGWGYNAQVPADADSTVWGLRLAESLGHGARHESARANQFFEKHLGADGGVCTYADAGPVRRFVGLAEQDSFAGWTQAHTCVTAAAAGLGKYRARLLPYLKSSQRDVGAWSAYWWFSDEYATAEAVEALVAEREPEETSVTPARLSVRRAAEWATDRCQRLMTGARARPPSFALSLALRAALACPEVVDTKVVAASLLRLVEWQKSDGAWPASARLRVPRPDCLAPDSQKTTWRMWQGLPPGPATREFLLEHTFSNYSLDCFGVFTCASVLCSLYRAREAL
jgi:hypothetical protein